MGAPTISNSAFNVFQPLSYARGPNGALFMANGVDRPARWDGITTLLESAGITAPTTAPTVADDTGGGSLTASSNYYCYYRYLDDDAPIPVSSSLSPGQLATTSSAGSHRIDWSGFVQSSETRVVMLQLWRNTAGQATALYLIGTYGHNGTVASEATSGGNCLFTCTFPHKLGVGCKILMAGNSVAGYNTTHTVTSVPSSLTFKTDIAHSSNGGTATWTLTGFIDDSRSDDELQDTAGSGGTISSSANSGGVVEYTTARPHNLKVGDQITVYSHSVAGYNGLQTVATCVTSTTFTTEKTYSAVGANGQWNHYSESRLILNNPDGSINADRFVPPPNFKAVPALFQDRMFWAADVEYTAGTVATNGTATITGTSTNWTATMVGRYIAIDGEALPYKITAWASATSITIERVATTTASGKSYAIRSPAGELNQIYYSEPLEPESVPADNVVKLQNNTGDDDEIVGLMPHGSSMYVLQKRHIYQLDFVSQPRIDASVSLVCSRGAISQRTWVYFEDTAYLMDYSGIYKFGGGAPEPISGGIQDMFRDGTIDFSVAKWFFASKDPRLEIVRFHYCESGETRPKKAICIHHRSGAVWLESYPWELGGAALISVSGALRLALGGQDDIVYLSGQGTLDGTLGSGTVRGTVTSSTSTTLSDSTATFPTDCVGASIAIVSGTGKGQERVITTRNSATQVTVATWTTNPDTTSIYQIGAIPLNFCTALIELKEAEHSVDSRIRVVAQPTTNAALLDARLWYNHDSAARNMSFTINHGTGVSVPATELDSIVLDLKKTRSDLANSTGYWQHTLPGNRSSEQGGADRWVAVQLIGYQGADQLKVYSLEINGTADEQEAA